MSDDKTGVRAGIKDSVNLRHAELLRRQATGLELLDRGGGQMSLLPMIADDDDDDDEAGAGAEANGDGLQILDQPADEAPGRRGPGRPRGARNKRTQHTLEYLQGLGYDDPLRGLAEVWSRPLALLAAELGCTLLEAFDRQQEARKTALPFWHQKLPQAVVIDKTAAMTLLHVNADEMLALLAERDDEIGRRGLELLGPLLELTAQAVADGETEDG